MEEKFEFTNVPGEVFELPKTYAELTKWIMFIYTHYPFFSNLVNEKIEQIVKCIKKDIPIKVKEDIAREFLLTGRYIAFQKDDGWIPIAPWDVKDEYNPFAQEAMLVLDGKDITYEVIHITWGESPYKYKPRPAILPLFKNLLFIVKLRDAFYTVLTAKFPEEQDKEFISKQKKEIEEIQDAFIKDWNTLLPFQEPSLDLSYSNSRIFTQAQLDFFNRFNIQINEAFDDYNQHWGTDI